LGSVTKKRATNKLGLFRRLHDWDELKIKIGKHSLLPMVVDLSLIESCTLTIFSGEKELSRAYQKLGSPLNVGMYPRDSLLS